MLAVLTRRCELLSMKLVGALPRPFFDLRSSVRRPMICFQRLPRPRNSSTSSSLASRHAPSRRTHHPLRSAKRAWVLKKSFVTGASNTAPPQWLASVS